MGSSNYLGVGGSSTDRMRRKSDSRLDAHQIAYLQTLATNSSNDINAMTSKTPSTVGISMEHLAQRSRRQQQSMYAHHSNLEDNSDYVGGYEKSDYDVSSELGPYQIMPPKAFLDFHSKFGGCTIVLRQDLK